jgi:hypothetical protein
MGGAEGPPLRCTPYREWLRSFFLSEKRGALAPPAKLVFFASLPPAERGGLRPHPFFLFHWGWLWGGYRPPLRSPPAGLHSLPGVALLVAQLRLPQRSKKKAFFLLNQIEYQIE